MRKWGDRPPAGGAVAVVHRVLQTLSPASPVERAEPVGLPQPHPQQRAGLRGRAAGRARAGGPGHRPGGHGAALPGRKRGDVGGVMAAALPRGAGRAGPPLSGSARHATRMGALPLSGDAPHGGSTGAVRQHLAHYLSERGSARRAGIGRGRLRVTQPDAAEPRAAAGHGGPVRPQVVENPQLNPGRPVQLQQIAHRPGRWGPAGPAQVGWGWGWSSRSPSLRCSMW